MAANFFFLEVFLDLHHFPTQQQPIWTGVQFIPQENIYEMWQTILCITAIRKPRLDREKKQK